MTEDAREVVMVPIDELSVMSPRARNRRQHQEIVENIDAIGLKRPITVRRKPERGVSPRYDVICGEGRLEAFKRLGQSEIPVVVVDATEEDCLLMGLAENLARRQHRAIDLVVEIGSLKQRGYSDNEVAEKIGVSASYVNMIAHLLNRGEERLVAAVETGLIPIKLAIDIARADDLEVQAVLAEAYAQGKIKGKKLAVIRRMIEQRAKGSKGVPDNGFGRKHGNRKLTPDELVRLYQRETEKQQLIVKRSDFTRSRLLFVVEALRDLLGQEGFATLLRAEKLNAMPAWLDEKVVAAGPRG
jgi:ParB family transcriptional regulator, chromosome partitioning protein